MNTPSQPVQPPDDARLTVDRVEGEWVIVTWIDACGLQHFGKVHRDALDLVSVSEDA